MKRIQAVCAAHFAGNLESSVASWNANNRSDLVCPTRILQTTLKATNVFVLIYSGLASSILAICCKGKKSLASLTLQSKVITRAKWGTPCFSWTHIYLWQLLIDIFYHLHCICTCNQQQMEVCSKDISTCQSWRYLHHCPTLQLPEPPRPRQVQPIPQVTEKQFFDANITNKHGNIMHAYINTTPMGINLMKQGFILL